MQVVQRAANVPLTAWPVIIQVTVLIVQLIPT